MNVFLFRNSMIPNSKNIALGVREYLTTQGVIVAVEDEDAPEVGAVPLSDVDPKTIEFVITLGGDGTILRMVHRHPEITAPIVGVNLGSLGFMADIPLTDIYPSLQEILNKKYTVQERMMMKGGSHHENSCFAVNEIAFHRAANPTLVDIAVHVDGSYLNTFRADGLILSTPCGSTAYSLASGGPILTPELSAFIITPISPHTISNRPIVLLPENEIQIQYTSELKPLEVSADGMINSHLSTGEVYHVQQSQKKFRLVKLPHHDYFSTLRTKLGWAGKITA